jgi:hypothetical protein
LSSNRFLEQFWPAITAGVLVALLTIAVTLYIQQKPEQSGTILYSAESATTNFTEKPLSPNQPPASHRRAATIINLLNLGGEDLSDFQIALSGFDREEDDTPVFYVRLDRALLKTAISANSIDGNGVLRLDFLRFDRDASVTIKLDTRYTQALTFQSSSKKIDLIRLSSYEVQKREQSNPVFPLLISVFTAILALLASFFSVVRERKGTSDNA